MPHIADEVESYLLGVAVVRAAVGERIYQDALRQNCQLPAIVLTTFGGDSVACLTGASAGICQTRVQVECFGATKGSAWDVSELVRKQTGGAGLQGYRGAMGSGNTFVNSSERVGDSTIGADPTQDKSDNRRWVATTDYLITHAETV